MPRIPSLSMLTTDDAKLYLKELYGNVIANVMKNLISARMKNRDLSGDPSSGSVIAKRFANAKPQKYGTARAAGKGEKVKGEEVVVQIDYDQEIVEEIEEKDVKLGGVDGLMDRRSSNHVVRMASDLDTKFFQVAFENAIKVEVDLTGPVEEVLETMIQELENTKNSFIDGVPRQMIRMVLNSAWYGKIRNQLDKTSRANVDTTTEEFYTWHGVQVDSCINLPNGCPFLVMCDGAIAQPVMSSQYKPDMIPMTEAWAICLFYHAGTNVVTPDLILMPKQSGSGTVEGATKFTNVKTENVLYVTNKDAVKLCTDSEQYSAA